MADETNDRVTLSQRFGRLTLRRVNAAVIVIVITCWILTVALGALLLTPVLDQVTVGSSSPADLLTRFLSPPWLRLLLTGVLATLSAAIAAGVMLARELGGERSTVAVLTRESALGAALGVPVLALLADQNWVAAATAAALGAAAELWVHRASVSAITIALGAVLATGPWVVVAVLQLTGTTGTLLWPSVFLLASCSAAFATFYVVPRVAGSRGRIIAPLFRNDRRAWVVVVITLIALAVVILRATVARTLFNPLDSLFWEPWNKGPMSWVIAAIVAALLTFFALRSVAHPFERFGSRRVIAALAVIGSIELFLALAVTVASLVIATFTGTVWGWTDWIDWYPIASFVFVVALGVVVLTRPFKASAGRAIGLVSVAYLLVPLLLIPLVEVLPLWVSAATPVQVAMLMMPIGIVLAVVNLVARRDVVAPGAIVRISVVPVVAVHAGLLLPAIVSDLGRVVVVIAAVLSILLFMPPVSADARRHSLDLLASSGKQLLAIATFVVALPSILGGDNQWGLGLLWLAIPTMAALMITTKPRSPVATESE